jgi:hypothetical protein
MTTKIVPVIVDDYIKGLLNKTTPDHIRYNYMVTLENIRDATSEALKKYEKEKNFRK